MLPKRLTFSTLGQTSDGIDVCQLYDGDINAAVSGGIERDLAEKICLRFNMFEDAFDRLRSHDALVEALKVAISVYWVRRADDGIPSSAPIAQWVLEAQETLTAAGAL